MPGPALKPIPVEVGRSGAADIRIDWNDGHRSVYPARYLRLHCACALCVEEMSGTRIAQDADIAADVHPLKISLVGRYALHIQWSDGHASGIYGFEILRSLCPCPSCRP